ncbi:hypothetical protein [Candidatus Nitronereus thalassa]|uniref:Uncharacterized protein n=1 Tax=Candidatus Nitronereus thalassa TaxID=3020898 RepID=A0ABU3KA96_9BACT|nr:hypothetical protein [Candidatus Nitronereus thalassa]MDT7043370.1 hypothetical protein [Candidatus Nitronereus thalassa]
MGLLPVSLQKIVRWEIFPSAGKLDHLNEMAEKSQLEVILVVLPSTNKMTSPAQYDLTSEVSRVFGQETVSHASVEIGILAPKSGKWLVQAMGTSSATLRELDVPMDSNRFPRITGSLMGNNFVLRKIRH